MEITCGTQTKFADNVKRIMRTTVPQKLLEEALKLTAAMKEKDIDEERLAMAKA